MPPGRLRCGGHGRRRSTRASNILAAVAGDDTDLHRGRQSHDEGLVASVLARSRSRRPGGARGALHRAPAHRLRAALRPARRLPVSRGQGPAAGDLLRRLPRRRRPHRAGDDLRGRARAVPQRVPRPRRRRGRLAVPSRPGDAARGHGVPVAINVGDATNVARAWSSCCATPSRSACARRCSSSARWSGWRASRPRGRRSSSGGSRSERFDLADRDYVRMAYKKTCWYTVIAPLRIGVVCGSAPGPLAPLE